MKISILKYIVWLGAVVEGLQARAPAKLALILIFVNRARFRLVPTRVVVLSLNQLLQSPSPSLSPS